MSDSTARVKPRSTLLEDMARATAARSPETSPDDGNDGPERSDPLPRPGDPYLAHARRAAKPQMMLFFVQKDYLPNGYSYANLERVRLEAADRSGDRGMAPPIALQRHRDAFDALDLGASLPEGVRGRPGNDHQEHHVPGGQIGRPMVVVRAIRVQARLPQNRRDPYGR
jgi:hypothetical protein